MPDTKKIESIDAVRHEVVRRIQSLCEAATQLSLATDHVNHATTEIAAAWEGWPEGYQESRKATEAMATMLNMIRHNISLDTERAAEQLGKLIARDVIAPVARDNEGPVVWLTGNAFMPPIRDIHEVELVWQADTTGEIIPLMIEALERTLDEEHIYMAAPEYDNALYVVDLTRWQYNEENENAEDLNDEWQPFAKMDDGWQPNN